jgi:hypothetical protein
MWGPCGGEREGGKEDGPAAVRWARRGKQAGGKRLGRAGRKGKGREGGPREEEKKPGQAESGEMSEGKVEGFVVFFQSFSLKPFQTLKLFKSFSFFPKQFKNF